MGDTSRSPTVSTNLRRMAQQAVDHPGMVFTTLAHHIDEELLHEAFRLTRKDGATGVDRLSGKTYARRLDDRIRDLHERLVRRAIPGPARQARMDRQGERETPPSGPPHLRGQGRTAGCPHDPESCQ